MLRRYYCTDYLLIGEVSLHISFEVFRVSWLGLQKLILLLMPAIMDNTCHPTCRRVVSATIHMLDVDKSRLLDGC